MSTETNITEFDDGTTIVTTTETEVVEGEGANLLEEAAEPIVDAAVQIAEIEAGRDIILAEIAAETRIAEAEAVAEIVESQEEETSWQNIDQNLQLLSSRLEAMEQLLSSLARSEALEASQSVTLPQEEESAAVMPDSQEAAESAPEPPKRQQKRRWI